ncbi:MAG TPA: hypothetical protein VGQ62_01980 [Chloroflexota bacterium]|jgi:hypothetical protein|nr:hypothetical protein [Chloroflexota bacterium]
MNAQPTLRNQSSTYFFNGRELARLAIYRAAVVARFYTDQCDPTPIRSDIDAVRLLNFARVEHARAA